MSDQLSAFEQAKKDTRNGAVATLIAAVITAIFAALSGQLDIGTLDDVGYYLFIDVAIMLVLALFIWKHSRLAAVLMLAYFTYSKYVQFVELQDISGLFVTAVIFYYLVRAVMGAFRYNKLKGVAGAVEVF